jgi:Flp pilus assembly pilin Flp
MWVLDRFVRDESGQDVIEYALLGALIAVLGILTWQNIGANIRLAYSGFDSGVQTLSICTPDPGGGGC